MCLCASCFSNFWRACFVSLSGSLGVPLLPCKPQYFIKTISYTLTMAPRRRQQRMALGFLKTSHDDQELKSNKRQRCERKSGRKLKKVWRSRCERRNGVNVSHHARSSVTGTLEWKYGIIRKQTSKSLASVLAPWSWNESVESSTSRATNPMSSDSGAYLQLERNTDDTSLHACLLEGTKDTWSSMRCNFVRMLERR